MNERGEGVLIKLGKGCVERKGREKENEPDKGVRKKSGVVTERK